MKNLTKNMIFAAAALVVAAGVAQAQAIKAEVPFSFRAAGAVMPAGEYWVNPTSSMSGTPIFKVTNAETGRSILAVPYITDSWASAGPGASLTFQCSGAHCALVKLANGTGRTYQFHSPSLGKDEDTRVSVIRAVLVKGR
jgi:hypothetical protein